MKIIDLTEEHTPLFCMCLEDWSDEAKEAGPKRAEWVERFKKRGLRAKLAVNDQGVVSGMIQYLPVEESVVLGSGLYFIPCIWVHGHKQGRGNLQGRGAGKALLEAAEQDALAMGAKGMSAWGIWLPFWMKASWFKKHGYKKADRQGLAVLLFKPFASDAQPPRWPKKKRPDLPLVTEGKVTITAFVNGWCMAQNLVYERAKKAAALFGDKVVFQELDTTDRAVLLEYGISDEVLLDGKPLQQGPPPSFEKIRKKIEKRVKRL